MPRLIARSAAALAAAERFMPRRSSVPARRRDAAQPRLRAERRGIGAGHDPRPSRRSGPRRSIPAHAAVAGAGEQFDRIESSRRPSSSIAAQSSSRRSAGAPGAIAPPSSTFVTAKRPLAKAILEHRFAARRRTRSRSRDAERWAAASRAARRRPRRVPCRRRRAPPCSLAPPWPPPARRRTADAGSRNSTTMVTPRPRPARVHPAAPRRNAPTSGAARAGRSFQDAAPCRRG